MWPNAHFYIKCDPTIKNIEYFNKIFNGYNYTITNVVVDCDLLFFLHEMYNSFGGILRNINVYYSQLLNSWKKPIYILFTEELSAPFEDYWDYVQRRSKNNNFVLKNKNAIDNVLKKDDWSDTTLLMSDNILENWADTHVIDKLKDIIKVSYISVFFQFDLPKQVSYKKNYDKKGIYLPSFSDLRIKLCNKLFSKNLDLTFLGSRSNELKPEIAGNGVYTDIFLLKQILQQYDWTIYIGKGKKSKYIGSTLYEPIKYGLPVFVWLGTDPEKKTFPTIDCYFSTEAELQALVDKWDIKDLYTKQAFYIFGNTPLDHIESQETQVITTKALF